jgi:hypothetical protein
MNKKDLRKYVNMRLWELEKCAETGAPTYIMAAINARIGELKSLLKMFGTEDQD